MDKGSWGVGFLGSLVPLVLSFRCGSFFVLFLLASESFLGLRLVLGSFFRLRGSLVFLPVWTRVLEGVLFLIFVGSLVL